MQIKEGIYKLAKRENNSKRRYVMVNLMQGKHYPTSPSQTLTYLSKLGKITASRCRNDAASVVIGFAETATAIGAAVAKEISQDTIYFHTTREIISDSHNPVEFVEEHSHATEQILYSHLKNEIWHDAQRIVFVDDEITTGNTIINSIEALNENHNLNPNTKFSVSMLINCLDEDNLLSKNAIDTDALLKVNRLGFDDEISIMHNFCNDISVPNSACTASIKQYTINGMKNPRRGVEIGEYHLKCEELAVQIQHAIGNINDMGDRILVLGTEEFMYPSLIFGYFLESYGKIVKCHSTTRSPIMPSSMPDYPLFSRVKLPSLYDNNRVTYIYNLDKYDHVFVITDSCMMRHNLGESLLCAALSHAGNDNISIVRWVD